MLQLNSSIRSSTALETISKARLIAPSLGITRVTEITKLDVIGIPVHASIRPEGRVLCVHNGKGLLEHESMAGAYMEAIEFALADPVNSTLRTFKSTFSEVQSGLPSNVLLTDFCFRYGRSCALEDWVICVKVEEINTGSIYAIPEELIFLPSITQASRIIFGFSTNGLASGNSVEEATVHALSEMIERDVISFDKVRDGSILVEKESLPQSLRGVIEKIEGADLEVGLRYTPNEFNVPVFSAYIFEEKPGSYCSVANGCGAHPVKEIAAMRALTEAVQSRLTAIHGGRDDLVSHFLRFKETSLADRRAVYQRLREAHLDASRIVGFGDSLVGPSREFSSIAEVAAFLVGTLRARGFEHIFRAVHYDAGGLAVVKLVAPRLEHFEHAARRIGPRLWNQILKLKLQ